MTEYSAGRTRNPEWILSEYLISIVTFNGRDEDNVSHPFLARQTNCKDLLAFKEGGKGGGGIYHVSRKIKHSFHNSRKI